MKEYKKRRRSTAIVFCSIFLVLGMSISGILRYYFQNPEGENMTVNLIGVFAGLGITIIIFSIVITRPWFADLRYGWALKREVLKVQNHRHNWEKLLAEGNETAAAVLDFYYKGSLLILQLDNNDFGYTDMEVKKQKFLEKCASLDINLETLTFQSDMLEHKF